MPRIRYNVLRLLDKLEPQVRRAFLLSIADVKSEAQLAVIVGAIERRDFEAAFQALNLRREFFAPLDDALRAAYLQGGVSALSGLPRLPGPFAVRALWLALMAATCEQSSS